MSRDRPAVEVTDAARMLASRDKPLSRSTVYRLIKAGELEAYQGHGNTSKYLIYEDSIEAYKQRQAVTPRYDRERIKRLLAT